MWRNNLAHLCVSERPSLRPQSDISLDCLLLGLMRDEFAIVAAPEPERNLPAEIAPAGPLVRLQLFGMDREKVIAALPTPAVDTHTS